MDVLEILETLIELPLIVALPFFLLGFPLLLGGAATPEECFDDLLHADSGLELAKAVVLHGNGEAWQRGIVLLRGLSQLVLAEQEYHQRHLC